MNDEIIALEEIQEDHRPTKVFVRVKTSAWHDRKGIHIRKDLTYLRKKCEGHNMLEEDVGMIGAEEILPRLLGLDQCDDGLYQVVTCNESRDWESGIIDDYDYKLIPYVPAP